MENAREERRGEERSVMKGCLEREGDKGQTVCDMLPHIKAN